MCQHSLGTIPDARRFLVLPVHTSAMFVKANQHTTLFASLRSRSSYSLPFFPLFVMMIPTQESRVFILFVVLFAIIS
jgi:hypothetical protein